MRPEQVEMTYLLCIDTHWPPAYEVNMEAFEWVSLPDTFNDAGFHRA